MGLNEIVNLRSHASLEEIQRFNSLFVSEKRLSDPRFLKWKYWTEKPGGDEITRHYGVLNKRGEIAGQISTQPMEVWLRGQWQQCQYWADWHSDPTYKGLGITLLLHVLKQEPSLLASSASKLAYKIYERMKFVLLPVDHRFVFICHPLMAILRSTCTPRRGANMLSAWSKKPFSRMGRAVLEPGFQFSEEKSVDPDLLMNWEWDVPRETVFVRREAWVFSWLLEKFPFPEFRLIIMSFKSQQLGYVLLHFRQRETGLVEGKLVDLYARGWKHTHLSALFLEGARRLAELGAHVIHYHATHPVFVSLAEENGFTRIRIQPIITYGPLATVLSRRETLLHMTYYDHDEAYY